MLFLGARGVPFFPFRCQVGSILLFILGVKCAIWHTQTLVDYMKQLPEHGEDGQPCLVEDEETDCVLGGPSQWYTVLYRQEKKSLD